ncbi:phosphotransferase [Streptomyces sp. NPDC051133]|uniref:phosphotransferase n=1 Tax=Streptomyces sp. NPDC051133 TaxID=3155521 RepID=UPI00341B0DC1
MTAFLARAVAAGESSAGFHHADHVLPLTEPLARMLGREPGTLVTVRVRRADEVPVVIRTWPGEPEILRAVRAVLPRVPECLAEGEGFAVHSYVEGTPLAELCGPGKPVSGPLLKELAELLAAVVQVRGTALPPLPPGWPSNHTDSQGFLRTLAHLADRQIRRPNWSRYGGLFVALGVPEDALLRFADRVPSMTRRPYGLLHGDLHRGNVVVPAAGERLHCVGWELACYGDPLHDLAVHLVRMRYPGHQWDEAVEAWAGAVRPAAVAGLARDLRHYVAFEHAQSLYAELIRAARTLEDTFDRPALDRATTAVHTAFRHAAKPLCLGRVPERPEIERVLFRRGVAARSLGEAPHGRAPAGTEPPPRPTARSASGTSTGPAAPPVAGALMRTPAGPPVRPAASPVVRVAAGPAAPVVAGVPAGTAVLGTSAGPVVPGASDESAVAGGPGALAVPGGAGSPVEVSARVGAAPVVGVAAGPAVLSAAGVFERGGVGWVVDRRVGEHAEFPYDAVVDALLLEGAAPAERVFKGAAHLTTVLHVPGTRFPVVVRREATVVLRREPSFLSEHAVLQAIERSGVPVAAPRVLALGTSHATDPVYRYRGDRFTVHTYEGARDLGGRPRHPVHGLLPHEADCLVDQLAALTGVDYAPIDPVADRPRFHDWLCEQLVALVAGLPKESQRLARFLGLPDAPRLREILARHRVTDRAPALLHGDLNPWNLVRRDDGPPLTLIDWELALVGDPLYDLVRHMHLTPTRPEIRDRMFRRWQTRLPERFTRNWQQDWPVYRWIETVRSAYVDLDRSVTGASLDAPNVRRAVESYAMTLAAATASLGLSSRHRAPRLTRALAWPPGPGSVPS